MASNPAMAFWLQSCRLVGRVAEFGSLGGFARLVRTSPLQYLIIVAAGICLFACLYVGSYFFLVRQGPTMSWPVLINGKRVVALDVSPDYRGLPARLFEPLHEFDRQHFRPGRWEFTSSIPWRESRSLTLSNEVNR